MEWPSIRDFLDIPTHLTGKNVAIAVIDGYFPPHPDITSNERRLVHLVDTTSEEAEPHLFYTNESHLRNSHGLMTAAAAGGLGTLSSGLYTGAAPEADLYLLDTGPFCTVEEIEKKFVQALGWLLNNWKKYGIRGVALTIADTRDTGLLPWQVDPIRVLCERLADEGLLIVVASGNTRELTCSGPASSSSVLSVGGVIVPHHHDEISPYHGCQGITFEGKKIPEILAPAENVVLPTPFISTDEFLNHYTASSDNLPQGYARNEGTSYAAPIILGCAACIWQANPEWTASQVQSALIHTAVYKSEWYEATAGLVNVKNAVSYSDSVGTDSLNKVHKQQDYSKQDVMDEKQLVASIFSRSKQFISQKEQDELKNLMFHSTSPKVRAAALCSLTTTTEITFNEIEYMLRDPDSYMKMAALFAVRYRADLWEMFYSYIVRLFSDPDINIQYCAIKLASIMGHPCFIKPLISGLLDDAEQLKVSTFGARCKGLESLTGIVYEPVPVFRDGQCWYSEESIQSRIHIALQWEQYASNVVDS